MIDIDDLLDRLEAAEKETASWKGLAKQFGNEADALRAKVEAAEKERDAARDLADRLALALNTSNHERDNLRAKIERMEKQEPVAKVRIHKAGGNAGIAWSVAPLNDFDSLPLMRDGDRLYALPGAKGE